MLRKGRLHKPCTSCGEMYPATTVRPGLCKKCKPPSLMDQFADTQERANQQELCPKTGGSSKERK